jgi:hypothetical protein
MIRVLSVLALLVIAPAARAADPAAEAAKSYRIETQGSTTEVKVGGKGTLVLSIVPVEKVHVHPQAPLKIALAARGLTLEKASLGHKDAVDPKAEAPRFEVPFVATAAGKQEATAKLDFFICSDQWCVKQTRDVTVAVNVK